MDELQLLVQTVAGLPTLTIWVLCGYLIYKLAVIGSIYGTIRYIADKFVEWRNKPIKYQLENLMINEKVEHLFIAQIKRLTSTTYIHENDIRKLKNAIDLMLNEDKK